MRTYTQSRIDEVTYAKTTLLGRDLNYNIQLENDRDNKGHERSNNDDCPHMRWRLVFIYTGIIAIYEVYLGIIGSTLIKKYHNYSTILPGRTVPMYIDEFPSDLYVIIVMVVAINMVCGSITVMSLVIAVGDLDYTRDHSRFSAVLMFAMIIVTVVPFYTAMYVMCKIYLMPEQEIGIWNAIDPDFITLISYERVLIASTVVLVIFFTTRSIAWILKTLRGCAQNITNVTTGVTNRVTTGVTTGVTNRTHEHEEEPQI